MTVGERIKVIRESKGISQEELAKRMGLKDKSSVCKIEKAGDNISTKSIKRYADALNTSVAQIMGWAADETTTDYVVELEEQGMQIIIEEQKRIGAAGMALRAALYNMTKPEIKKLYDVARIMAPHAFVDDKEGEQ